MALAGHRVRRPANLNNAPEVTVVGGSFVQANIEWATESDSGRSMLWLDREAFFDEVKAIRLLPGPPQLLHLGADPQELYRSVPLPPANAREDEDFPGPTDRWYGKLSGRYLTLDVCTWFLKEAVAAGVIGVAVTTCYPLTVPGKYDWMTLRELSGLPSAIDPRNIGTVTSRVEQPALSVHRRDDRGFDFPVYNASCEEEAAGLLRYLGDERRYFAGPPEQEGHWYIERIANDGRRVVIGHYIDRAGTIVVACNASSRDELTYRVYPGADNVDRSEWHVSRGRVIDRA